jgi:tripartite-type tricarboxylate transporter receptor subunit TctC
MQHLKLPRRKFLHLAGAVMLPVTSRIAGAQAYPARPVRIIVPFSAGTSADTYARLMGQWLSERLGQPFVVEDRPGAGGNIATEAVVKAAPDGYTLLWVTGANATANTFNDKLSFNYLRDVAPVAGIFRTAFVMAVNPGVPARTVPEFIAYAKANPGKVNMATGGSGTGIHLYSELFKSMTGLDITLVHYRGDVPALTDLIGGQVQVMFAGSAALEYLKAGKLRGLAVSTKARWDALPDLPTLADFGYEASGFQGLGAPRDTPSGAIERINREINAALANPKVKARYADLGVTAIGGSPADFDKLVRDDTEKWANLIRTANIKVE